MDDLTGILAAGRGNKDNGNKSSKMEVLEIKCNCNAMMEIQTPQSVYGEHESTFCRECNEFSMGTDYIFHCPKGKISTHKDGYDLCYNCGIRRNVSKNDKKNIMLRKQQTARMLPRVRAFSVLSDKDDESKNSNDNNGNSILYNSLYLMAEDRIQVQKMSLKKKIDKISNQTAWKQMIKFEQSREDRVKQKGDVSLRQDSADYVTFANKLGK